MRFFVLISILFSFSLSFFFPSFLSLSGFVALFIVFLSHSIMAGCFFYENRFCKNIEAEI